MSGKSHSNYGKLAQYDEEIKQLLMDGLGPYQIANKLGFDASSIKVRVKKIGLSFKEKIDLNDHLEEILLLRNQKVSLRTIAKKFNTNHVSLSNFLSQRGESTKQFTHQFDENFFEIIDTEEKAWCLGLMMSDGCIKQDGLCLNMTDRDVIEKFKASLKYDGDIRVTPGAKEHHKTKYEVNIYSIKMVKDISKYGVIPNKSLTLKFPSLELIPAKLLYHLVRGIFDGDGSIFQEKRSLQWKVVFTGTKEVLQGVEDVSGIKGNFFYIGEKTGSNTWNWKIRKIADVYNFLQWMYKDATIYMDRKFVLAQKCLPANNILCEMMDLLDDNSIKYKKDNQVIIIEDKKLVIEYISFHNNKENKYCFRQRKKYAGTDYKYLAIFEDEWFCRRRQVENFILSKLGIYKERIFARKCSIDEVPAGEAIKFICEAHIQPVNNAGAADIGLFHNNKLVGICQLRIHHRNNKDITISRMCFAEGIQIVGGFSRLVAAAIEWCKNNKYDKLITWSDNRLTEGQSYIKAGFTKDATLAADYSYVHPDKPHKRVNKQVMQKKKLKVPEGYTERQWTEKLGYSRIYDAGKTRFIYMI